VASVFKKSSEKSALAKILMRWLGGTQNADPCVFHPHTYIPDEFVTQIKNGNQPEESVSSFCFDQVGIVCKVVKETLVARA
jgi:hypothetical protein